MMSIITKTKLVIIRACLRVSIIIDISYSTEEPVLSFISFASSFFFSSIAVSNSSMANICCGRTECAGREASRSFSFSSSSRISCFSSCSLPTMTTFQLKRSSSVSLSILNQILYNFSPPSSKHLYPVESTSSTITSPNSLH
jgi:hypothetical protein